MLSGQDQVERSITCLLCAKSWEHSKTDRNPPGASLPIPPSVGQRCGRLNASRCCGYEKGRDSSEDRVGTVGSQRSGVCLALRPRVGLEKAMLGGGRPG